MSRAKDPKFDRGIARVAATCTCANLRRAMRAVTQAYDAALAPSGLKATQFNVLVAIARRGRPPLSRLAEALVMDRTTLTRNLRPLERRGLVKIAAGEDRRVREIGLTTKGRRALERALPLWDEAQGRVLEGLGQERWEGFIADLGATVSVTERR